MLTAVVIEEHAPRPPRWRQLRRAGGFEPIDRWGRHAHLNGMILAHSTCVAFDGNGVLLRGPSGSGKSDLALRAMAEGARLVADDQVLLCADAGILLGTAPAPLKGLIEVRGLGVMRTDQVDPMAPIRLVVDLVPPDAVERMPDGRRCTIAGVETGWATLAPFEASAVVKLRWMLAAALDPTRVL